MTDQIADYLRQHPEFFNQHAELLAELRIPHPHGTHAVSITERQVMALRDKARLLENKLAELIQFGEENDGISEKMHRLSLSLIAAPDLVTLLGALNSHLQDGFGVPHSAVRLWDTHATENLPVLAPVSDGLRAQVDTQRRPVCGPLPYAEAASWFGEIAPHLRSFATIPLREERTHGLLILASEEPRRFYPEMGTLYLERLGQLIGAAVARMT